jgi:hypothetical protein
VVELGPAVLVETVQHAGRLLVHVARDGDAPQQVALRDEGPDAGGHLEERDAQRPQVRWVPASRGGNIQLLQRQGSGTDDQQLISIHVATIKRRVVIFSYRNITQRVFTRSEQPVGNEDKKARGGDRRDLALVFCGTCSTIRGS